LAPAGVATTAPAGAPRPKSKKPTKRLVVWVGAAVGVIVLALAGVLVVRAVQENRRADSYAAAVALMDKGDFEAAISAFQDLGGYEDSTAKIAQCEEGLSYAEAQELFDQGKFEDSKAAFEALGDYKDAADKAALSGLHVEFANGQGLFEAGDLDGARTVFAALSDGGFTDADEWVSKCDYQLAEALLADSQNLSAFEAFTALGSYQDSAERAQACKLGFPKTSELWHGDAFLSDESAIKLDLTNTTGGHYFKVYSADYSAEVPVANLFVNGGDALTIDVPAGKYIIKEATGTDWWGPGEMFGPDGEYTRMTYDDGNDWFELHTNSITTITFNVSDGGNIGDRDEPLDEF
jgi:hypothetical protein